MRSTHTCSHAPKTQPRVMGILNHDSPTSLKSAYAYMAIKLMLVAVNFYGGGILPVEWGFILYIKLKCAFVPVRYKSRQEANASKFAQLSEHSFARCSASLTFILNYDADTGYRGVSWASLFKMVAYSYGFCFQLIN